MEGKIEMNLVEVIQRARLVKHFDFHGRPSCNPR